MHPLMLIGFVFVGAIASLCAAFVGLGLLRKWFGPERVERYLKLRTQGPFVPTPEESLGKKL